MYIGLVQRAVINGNHKNKINIIKRALATQTYNLGDLIHGYKLEQVEFIKDLNITPHYLKHEATGAEHLHIHKEGDGNNVFSVSLRTTPKNSTGVAHILEHTALCGSKKYPVRDPFFKMITRSLATFMNAFTHPDLTQYPFSTQNSTDFENLLRVYTDAVFFPRLRAVDFRQEGWRLEHEKPDKKETPIMIKGVVYNEMKGVFSSSSAIYSRYLLNNLFPDTTYSHESGGDPLYIPSLSHQELTKFHKMHYHPSNAKFFTYGDMPLENHLKLVNELVLSKFTPNYQAREESIVKEQEPWKEPKEVNITCPFDPLSPKPEKQTTTSISYLLPTVITNLEQSFYMQILGSLLIDGPNAPFYKKLIESGLGSDYSPSTGLGNFTKQPYFSVGLQNLHPNDVTKVHSIIQETFEEAARDGFPQQRVDAILHDIELSLKHVRSNFGLGLCMSIGSIWNHDGDPIDYLRVNKYVEKFKNSLAENKEFWSHLIRRNFLENKHKLIMTMNPDLSFEEKRKENERKLLENLVSRLDETEKQTLVYEGMELMKIQNSKEDVSVLPCLLASKDIPRDLPQKTELRFDQHKGVNIQFCEQPTNELVYFKGILDVGDRLKDDLLDYLPLFCDVATKLGAGSYDKSQLSQRIQLKTGGLSVSMLLCPDLEKPDEFKNQVLIGSHCLRRNSSDMFELWTNIFKQIHFKENKEYLHQLIKASAAELADSVPDHGQSYAMKRASSSLTKLSCIDERLSGLEYLVRLKDIASVESIESISDKLQTIASIILDPFSMKCALNAEPEAMNDIHGKLSDFIDHIQGDYVTERVEEKEQSGAQYDLQKEDRSSRTKVEDMKFPFATHYVAKSLKTVPKLHPDHPKLVIMAKLISSKYLLPEVREKGGAYGAGLNVSTSGIMAFFSYCDPETEKTMSIFNNAHTWLERGTDYTEQDIEESKLAVFQAIDKPVEPGRRGLRYFSMGESDEMRDQYRKRLLEVTLDDVKKVAGKYLEQEKVGRFII